MEFLTVLGKTVLLRPYVFVPLMLALAISVSLMGRTRTTIFFLITWMVAFACEFSSTRTGIPFGVPIANYLGWALVGLLALGLFRLLEPRLGAPPPDANMAGPLLLGAALYFGVVIFNLAMTFWIGEPLIGWTGLMLYLPVSGLLWLRLAERAPLKT